MIYEYNMIKDNGLLSDFKLMTIAKNIISKNYYFNSDCKIQVYIRSLENF